MAATAMAMATTTAMAAVQRVCTVTRARSATRRPRRRQIRAEQGLRREGECGGGDGDVIIADEIRPRHHRRHHLRRRDALVAFAATVTSSTMTLSSSSASSAATVTTDETLVRLQREAAAAYDAQDFTKALDALSRLSEADPGNLNWIEGRAQVAVDAKRFAEAVRDYTSLLEAIDPEKEGGAAARFRAGRALAYEGLYAWPLALVDYDEVLRLADVGGFYPDPYILNSRGNVRASLDDWSGAREDYQASARLFQGSKGFRSGASTTQRLDGAVYSASNAALALAQLGDDAGATKEFEAVMRRAPNSADARAALAALYYSKGRVAEAEEAWDEACGRNVGCAKYKDMDYVRRIRRWPPKMVSKLEDFLKIK